MFLTNKYTMWYYKIIDSAKCRQLDGYTEKHHIIPRSIGGTNTKDNKVSLTAREHYICHMLLPKMVISTEHKTSMWFAAWCMLRVKNQNQDRYTGPKSKFFEAAKQKAAEASKLYWTGKKRPPRSDEHTRRQRESHIGQVSYTRTDKHTEHQRLVQTGKKKRLRTTEERRAKSVSMKEKWNDLEYRTKVIKSRTGLTRRPLTEEVRRKISDSMKRRNAANRCSE